MTSPTSLPRRTVLGALLLSFALAPVALYRESTSARVDAVESSAAPQDALWLTPPSDAPGSSSALAKAIDDLNNDRAAAALPVFQARVADLRLGGYASLYQGRAQLALEQFEAASATAKTLLDAGPTGALLEAAHWLAVESAEAAGDREGTVRALQALIATKPVRYAEAYLRLGRAAVAAGDDQLALESFRRLYYEFSLTAEAKDAERELAAFATRPVEPSVATFRLDLGRAERFFGARRYTEARKVYAGIKTMAAGDDRDLIDLRLAECDYHLGSHTAARNALRVYLDKSTSRLPEARFYHVNATRVLGRHAEYLTLARTFIDDYPDDPLAEHVLDQMGTHFILQNEDQKAADVFAELYRRFPNGAYADRAAWKSGWWAYKAGDYAETIRVFESAAVGFLRADYRPSWLYWAARAHAQIGERSAAVAGYQRVIEFYRNSYYGRQAALEIGRLLTATRPGASAGVAPASRELPPTIAGGDLPSNAELLRALLAEGLYAEAIAELRRVQRDRGTSPLVEATIAFALNRQGQLRPAITAMRRAYPQFMAAGGEALPEPLLRVIFPVDYWDLIARYASDKKLDPFLMAALIAQESTFQADVRSSANAYGLMQIIPATGRRYASAVGLRRVATSHLINPETNIRIGMTYFSDLMRLFGDTAPALAAYNAGESRVSRWIAERPGIDRDEFIDDIPFPETQNYVKRILGTADDYRQLYDHLAERR